MESMQCWVVEKQNKGSAELQELLWCQPWVLAAGIPLGQTLLWLQTLREGCSVPGVSLTVPCVPADPGPAQPPPAEGVTPPPAGAPPASAAP